MQDKDEDANDIEKLTFNNSDQFKKEIYDNFGKDCAKYGASSN